ncbi:hypothetical protein F4809DRAFT_588373 [Biscogniauxia mediterranea]|nr:hypothetical protein F4809DRAFT_588373 [Biscogniauxia mediterranea]
MARHYAVLSGAPYQSSRAIQPLTVSRCSFSLISCYWGSRMESVVCVCGLWGIAGGEGDQRNLVTWALPRPDRRDKEERQTRELPTLLERTERADRRNTSSQNREGHLSAAAAHPPTPKVHCPSRLSTDCRKRPRWPRTQIAYSSRSFSRAVQWEYARRLDLATG